MLGRLFRPVRLPAKNLEAFVLIERVISPHEARLSSGMPSGMQQAMPPVVACSWDRLRPDRATSLRTLARICEEPLLIVLGESADRDRPFRSAWISDATGIIEAMAAARSNLDVKVAVDTWKDTSDLVTDRHLRLVGAGDVNAYALAVHDLMAHLRFHRDDQGVVNIVRAFSTDDSVDFCMHQYDMVPAGFVSVSNSPFDLHRSLVWVAGVNGPATQTAARLLRELIADPNTCLRRLGLDENAHPIGCVVAQANEMSDDRLAVGRVPQRRIGDFELIWAVDGSGHRLRTGVERRVGDFGAG